MAKRRKRKSSRRSNPEYSDAVYELVSEFIETIDVASNTGYRVAKKIQAKAGDLWIADKIERTAESLRDLSEELEDKLGD